MLNEERKKIYEEERARIEARTQIEKAQKCQIRLKKDVLDAS